MDFIKDFVIRFCLYNTTVQQTLLTSYFSNSENPNSYKTTAITWYPFLFG